MGGGAKGENLQAETLLSVEPDKRAQSQDPKILTYHDLS